MLDASATRRNPPPVVLQRRFYPRHVYAHVAGSSCTSLVARLLFSDVPHAATSSSASCRNQVHVFPIWTGFVEAAPKHVKWKGGQVSISKRSTGRMQTEGKQIGKWMEATAQNCMSQGWRGRWNVCARGGERCLCVG